jgi:hypothetical protein
MDCCRVCPRPPWACMELDEAWPTLLSVIEAPRATDLHFRVVR